MKWLSVLLLSYKNIYFGTHTILYVCLLLCCLHHGAKVIQHSKLFLIQTVHLNDIIRID